MHAAFRRDGIWLAVALAFGVLLLPVLVYVTGVRVLGPYADGTLGRFLAAFYGDLTQLDWQAVALALTPAALVLLWRLAFRLLRTRPDDADGDHAADRTGRAPSSRVRREPTL